MGKVKLFPTAEYTSKQPRDPIVPREQVLVRPFRNKEAP